MGVNPLTTFIQWVLFTSLNLIVNLAVELGSRSQSSTLGAEPRPKLGVSPLQAQLYSYGRSDPK